MNFILKNKEKLRSVFIVTLSGVIVAPVFTAITFGLNPVTLLKGLLIGFMITFVSSLIENFVFKNNFNKLKFSVTLFIRTIFYIFIISFSVLTVWVVHESSLNDESLLNTIKSEDFRKFILTGDFKNIFFFAIAASFVINFFMQINSLLGKKVLINYITGKYHKPRIEFRTFMFLDLTSSTTIAEKLGPVKYHNFINNFFFDIDEAIVKFKGEIYQYVGDEVIVSWIDNTGFEKNSCVNCFLEMKNIISRLSKNYINRFGYIPEFKAGVHYGEVVTGEIGDSKKEIVFHGDVLNTASRIQAFSKTLDKDILISKEVQRKLNKESNMRIENIGKYKLKGKEIELELFSVEFF
ncbi:MAG TPA: adenylate/guanylate cyclase domain-containing protein [Ignavibacteria bacterium]|nr:adenylate/guanylate cyclase domain-containing protein [Ignavibacteria bacterium]